MTPPARPGRLQGGRPGRPGGRVGGAPKVPAAARRCERPVGRWSRGGGGPSRQSLLLGELRANQAAKRRRVYDQVELTELRACKQLAFQLFGECGVVEFDVDLYRQQRLGALAIGRYLDPVDPKKPGFLRRVRILFQGASHRELVDQVKVWKAAGGRC